MKFDYNIVVIGAGSGGLVSAYIASALNAKVALIEKHKMGGDCLNTGCVPSKALIRSAKIVSYAKRAKEFGLKSGEFQFDFADVMESIQSVIRQIEPHDSAQRYQSLGVECIQGEAKIISPHEVKVGNRILKTRNIIIATGSSPRVPNIAGLKEIDHHTSDTIWSLRKLPKKLLILGGGTIGCELAQAFQRLGSQVTQIEKNQTILSKEDVDVSVLISGQLGREGIHILTQCEPRNFQNNQLVIQTNGKEKAIEFDTALLALGRVPNIRGFGLEELGVEIAKNGTIANDPFLRTNYRTIYVCGDVAGPYQFTHFASYQAWFSAINALFSPFKKFKIDYRVIPWATFTDPEIARVGLSEKDAQDQGIPYELTKFEMRELDRAIVDRELHGFVKVLTVPKKDQILGVTIVGHHASDLIAEYVTAMKFRLGLNQVLNTIHTYPTMAEANKYAAGVWKKAHAPQTVLGFLRKFHAWRRGAT